MRSASADTSIVPPGERPLVRESLDARPTQHRVLRQITEAFARTIATGVKECYGKEIPVALAYQGDALKKPHLTLIHYWVERANDRLPDRVVCKTDEGDEFHRAAPIILTVRYMLTAWAPAPDDQELLAAAIRVVYDAVEIRSAEEEPGDGEDAVHWEDKVTPELSQRFSMDEARLVCESLGMPFRASVRYDLSFRLDSERKTAIRRVKERIVDYKKLDS